MSIDERIEAEREELHKLIEQNAEYDTIVKQSEALDKLISKKMRQ